MSERFLRQAAAPYDTREEVDALRAEAHRHNVTHIGAAKVRSLLATYYRLAAKYEAQVKRCRCCSLCTDPNNQRPADDGEGSASEGAASPAEGQRP